MPRGPCAGCFSQVNCVPARSRHVDWVIRVLVNLWPEISHAVQAAGYTPSSRA
jgi:hypothetical protein